ncbi:glycosyltransferase family 49 protein [Auriscalpium vulgare]|uniref:Glycosyltransferase family 49 protein n=1 Tax=Auriscalpium vulgare TaxID=40419 RepID=A0ACB8RB22_9AGAM|nr:glycosyltransferase family 49 protein [Auriscalpium vulgare]
MHPMKIIPYFYRASQRFEDDDITVTTLVTHDRFEVLRKLAVRYDGPLSVTIHLPFQPESTDLFPSALNDSITVLHSLVLRTPALSARADVHLVLSPYPRAFNAWRNIARLFARTGYVLLLDVDFAICTQWRTQVLDLLRKEDGEMARRMREGSVALVLPAFEYVKADEGRDQAGFPRDKSALLELVRGRKIAPFHASWALGHNSTDYKRFYGARKGEMYRVTTYQSAYEPYVIVKRDAGGWCDERFTGYGGNKAACLFEMYLSGVSFYVLSDHFLIHQSHPYEEAARKSERRYNRRVYADFKEEACLRRVYLIRFRDEGVLNTTRAHNVREECKKIRALAKLIPQVS